MYLLIYAILFLFLFSEQSNAQDDAGRIIYTAGNKVYSFSFSTKKEIEIFENQKNENQIGSLLYVDNNSILFTQWNRSKGDFVTLLNLVSKKEVFNKELNIRAVVDGNKKQYYILKNRELYFVDLDSNKQLKIIGTGKENWGKLLKLNHEQFVYIIDDQAKWIVSKDAPTEIVENQKILPCFPNISIGDGKFICKEYKKDGSRISDFAILDFYTNKIIDRYKHSSIYISDPAGFNPNNNTVLFTTRIEFGIPDGLFTGLYSYNLDTRTVNLIAKNLKITGNVLFVR